MNSPGLQSDARRHTLIPFLLSASQNNIRKRSARSIVPQLTVSSVPVSVMIVRCHVGYLSMGLPLRAKEGGGRHSRIGGAP